MMDPSKLRAINKSLRAREKALQHLLALRNRQLKSVREKINAVTSSAQSKGKGGENRPDVETLLEETLGMSPSKVETHPRALGENWESDVLEPLQGKGKAPRDKWGGLFDDYESSGDEGGDEGRDSESAAPFTEEESYTNFWERLSRPASTALVHRLTAFIERTNSSDLSRFSVEAGGAGIECLITDFLSDVENEIYNHVSWRDAADEELDAAREGLEKYVMNQIYKAVFAEPQDIVQDNALAERSSRLQFITPDMLGVPESCRNDVVLGVAQEELCKMNSMSSPGEKIACIARACQVLFNVLNRTSGSRGRAGADDFLPAFIYTVLRARVPNLVSNIEFIRRYRNPSDLMSKSGYFFVNLRSAVEFIRTVDAKTLALSQEQWDAHINNHR